MMKRTKTLAVVAMAGLMHTAAQADGQRDLTFDLTTGLEFSTGEFGGTENIDELYVPVSANVDYGRLGFRLVVPYLQVRGPAGTTTTGENGDTVSGSGPRVTESGLGDIVGSVTLYDVIDNPERGLFLDATATIKFGTADEAKGLGTGENDYSGRLDAYKYFDRFALLGTAGYKVRGDPADTDLDDVFFGTIGVAYQTRAANLVGLYYDYRQSALVNYDDIEEITGIVSTRINENWDLQVYAFAGLTDSSPDWGGGLSVTTDFWRFSSRDLR